VLAARGQTAEWRSPRCILIKVKRLWIEFLGKGNHLVLVDAFAPTLENLADGKILPNNVCSC